MSKETEINLILRDTSHKRLIDANDIKLINLLANIDTRLRFEVKYKEGEVYAYSEGPILVPKGKAWIKLSGMLPAGYRFQTIFDTASKLKKEFNKSI